MKRKVKRPFDNEQFRKGYVAGIFAAEKELNTELLHFAEKAHKIMSEGTFPDYGVKINFKDSNNTITTNLDMKTEQKAKKYDEALEWMRKVYPTLTGAAKEDAEHYFPELKESKDNEDERIRKDLIKYLESDRDCQPCQDVSFYDSSITWLEKQKEQKPEAKFTGWVARDREFDSYYGTGLILYSKKPRRSDNCWNGDIVMQLPWELFPEIKWMDEPMEVEIIIRKK